MRLTSTCLLVFLSVVAASPIQPRSSSSKLEARHLISGRQYSSGSTIDHGNALATSSVYFEEAEGLSLSTYQNYTTIVIENAESSTTATLIAAWGGQPVYHFGPGYILGIPTNVYASWVFPDFDAFASPLKVCTYVYLESESSVSGAAPSRNNFDVDSFASSLGLGDAVAELCVKVGTSSSVSSSASTAVVTTVPRISSTALSDIGLAADTSNGGSPSTVIIIVPSSSSIAAQSSILSSSVAQSVSTAKFSSSPIIITSAVKSTKAQSSKAASVTTASSSAVSSIASAIVSTSSAAGASSAGISTFSVSSAVSSATISALSTSTLTVVSSASRPGGTESKTSASASRSSHSASSSKIASSSPRNSVSTSVIFSSAPSTDVGFSTTSAISTYATSVSVRTSTGSGPTSATLVTSNGTSATMSGSTSVAITLTSSAVSQSTSGITSLLSANITSSITSTITSAEISSSTTVANGTSTLSLNATSTISANPTSIPTITANATITSTIEPNPAYQTSVNFAGKTYINKGLVGFGAIPGDAIDSRGETIGGIGSAIALQSFKRNGDSYSGVIILQPDRGHNTETVTNYIARRHFVSFTLDPYYNSTNLEYEAAKSTFQLTYDSSLLYYEKDGTPTTGLDATSYRNGSVIEPIASNTFDHITTDAEGFVLNPDGTSWVSDEYGPYIWKYSATGQLLDTIVPPRAVLPYKNGSLYFTAEASAGPDTGRVQNQGLEGLTISDDGNTLYALLQSGLTQDLDSNGEGRYTRLFIYDVSGTPTLLHSYVLVLPVTNGKAKALAQSDFRSIGDDTFMLLSRDGKGNGDDDSESKHKDFMLFNLDGATDIVDSEYTNGVTAVAPGGTLNSDITPIVPVEFIDIIDKTHLERFGLHNDGDFDVSLINSKWESSALASVHDEAYPSDYFLFSFSDNDFITTDGYEAGASYDDSYGYTLDNQALVWRITLP